MQNAPDINQLIEQIQIQFKNFKEKIGIAKKMKGRKRLEYIETTKDRDFKRIRTYINHLQTSINFSEQSLDELKTKENRELVEKFKNRLERYIKKLESSKDDALTDDVIFQERMQTKKNLTSDRKLVVKQIDQAQKQSQQAVKRALRNMYEMQGISQNVNVELQRQINELDSIYQTLHQTESSMNRALRFVNYFARSVYTDKILMALIVLIIIAIIVIIVLTSMGKIPSSNQNSLF